MRRTALIVLCNCVFGVMAFTQTPSSAVWSLTADQSAIITGEVTAQSQLLSSMQVSYSNGIQRSSPAGAAGTWPAESTENPSRYMQFAVTPLPNVDFTVSSIFLKLYVNSGSGMSAAIYYSTDSTFGVRTKIGGTVTLSSSTPATPNIAAAPDTVIHSGESFYLRIYPWYNNSTTGKYVIANSVTITGSTVNDTAPVIAPSVAVLSSFGKVIAGNGVNGETYRVSASNLVSDLIIRAPIGFSVSLDSVLYADSLTIAPVAGSVTGVPIYTRFAPASASGLTEAVLVHHSAGAAVKCVDVTGVSLAPEPSSSSSVSFSAVTGHMMTIGSVGGNGDRLIVVVRKDSAVSFAPVDGVEYSGIDAHFSAAADQCGGNKIVYDGDSNTVTVTGLSAATSYHVALFQYNTGTGNSHNYRITDPGRGNTVTLEEPGVAVSPAVVSFGSTVISDTSEEKSFLLSGSYLSPSSGTMTVTTEAPFEISLTEGSGFGTVVQVPYILSTVNTVHVFVRFLPTEKIFVQRPLVITGGGIAAETLLVSGSGVDRIVVPDSVPMGFASLDGGTTGGKGGTEVVITTPQQMADIMKPREKSSDPQSPLILYVTGALSGLSDAVDVKRTRNISIIGVGSEAKIQGFGFKIVESSNIIIRNITFADAKAGEKDAVSIEGSHNVWIDHCSFTDSPSIDVSGGSHDGLLDVKKGSYNVTISCNYFTNHRKTCLFGHSLSEIGDSAMRVTYSRNWFDGTYSRHPRARYGKAHILNNLFTGIGVVGTDAGGYAVGSTCSAHLLVEGNYFENTPTPTLISQINDPGETLSGDPAGFLKSLNNHAVGSGTIVENVSGFDFDPAASYSYTPLDAQSVKTEVMESAGAGKMSGGSVASVPSGTTLLALFGLRQNYPNPFNPSTTIQFSLPGALQVRLTVVDMLGREVARLLDAVRGPGNHRLVWSAHGMPSGVYVCRLEAGGEIFSKKLILLK